MPDSHDLSGQGRPLSVTGVSFAVSGFKRARLASGGLVEFRLAKGQDAEAARLAMGALALAFAEEVADLHDRTGGDEDIQLDEALPGIRGPMLPVWDISPSRMLTDFLTALAGGLEEAGFAGKLTPVANHIDHHFGQRIPTLQVQLRLPFDLEPAWATWDPLRRQPEGRWWVDPDTTTRIVKPLLDWATDIGGTIEVSPVGQSFLTAPEAAWPLLASMAHRMDVCLVSVRASPSPRIMRRVSLVRWGWISAHDYDDTVTPRDPYAQLERVSARLRAAAPEVVYGRVVASGFMGSTVLTRPSSGATSRMAHLEHEYVHQPAVQQVLTGAHLARTTDLAAERWEVEEIAADRYLVTARDLTGWLDLDPTPFADRDPAYSTIPSVFPPAIPAYAHTDFGAAVLTARDVIDNPPPDLAPEHVEDWRTYTARNMDFEA